MPCSVGRGICCRNKGWFWELGGRGKRLIKGKRRKEGSLFVHLHEGASQPRAVKEHSLFIYSIQDEPTTVCNILKSDKF